MNEKLQHIDSNWVDPDDAPELTLADFDRPNLVWRVNGKVVSSSKASAAFRAALKKQKINIALDSEVVTWFKEQAGGRGYQTLINAALLQAMQQKTFEETLRRVIREELHSV